jgi:hypothetical protein
MKPLDATLFVLLIEGMITTTLRAALRGEINEEYHREMQDKKTRLAEMLEKL